MLFSRLFLSVLVLTSSGVAAAADSSSPLLRFGKPNRALHHSPDIGNLAGDCVDPEFLYYNLFFELEDEGTACATCGEGNFTDIGLLIKDKVHWVDHNYPLYENEFLDTKVCPIPGWAFGENQDGGRKLGSYTYKAGGRCRRCKRKRRRRLDEEEGSEDYWFGGDEGPDTLPPVTTYYGSGDTAPRISETEGKEATCDLAATAKFALSVNEKGVEHCEDLLEDIDELILKVPDKAKANRDKAQAQEKCNSIMAGRQAAVDAANTAELACTTAQQMLSSAGGSGSDDEGSTLDELKIAEAGAQAAMSAATNAQSLYAQARRFKHILMKDVMMADFEHRDKKLKKLVAEAEKEYQEKQEQIMERIAELEEMFGKQETVEEEEAIIEEEMDLEMMLARQRHKHDELNKAWKDWQEDVHDKHDFAKKLDESKYAMATALTLDAWLEQYRLTLEIILKEHLVENYTLGDGGCIDEKQEDDFFVRVEIVEVETMGETLSQECTLAGNQNLRH